MAIMTTNGVAEFAVSLGELEQLPGDLLDEMLFAQADVIEPAQIAKGRTYGVHRTGVTLESIDRGKPKKIKDGKAIYIYPDGINADGNRNAEVAFINEFGKQGQPARPFIRDANEENAEEAESAAARVYDKWLNSNGL